MAALGVVQLSFFPASSSSSKFLSNQKQLASVKLNLASSAPSLSLNFPFSPLCLNNYTTTKPCFVLLSSAVQEAATTEEETAEQSQEPNSRKQLFLYRLPYSLTVEDLKTLLSECGTVEEAELITKKIGKNRGFGFVTMSTPEEAQAVIDKFDSHEVSGKIMRVEFAYGSKKPDLPPPPPRVLEFRVHVANLDLKVRVAHLKEFFSTSFNPTTARIVFHRKRDIFRRNGETRYGFVGFATKEEAEAAIAALDRKELMGKQLRLALSDKNVDESASEKEEQDTSEEQLNDL